MVSIFQEEKKAEDETPPPATAELPPPESAAPIPAPAVVVPTGKESFAIFVFTIFFVCRFDLLEKG